LSSLKVATRLITFEPAKILDLQENDTTVHTADLTGIIPPGTIAILIQAQLQAGAGSFIVHSSSGSTIHALYELSIVPIINQELKWKNTVANDDWDIYLHAYFIEIRTR